MAEARIDLTVASEEVSNLGSQGQVSQPTNPVTGTTATGLTPEQLESRALGRRLRGLQRRVDAAKIRAESTARSINAKVLSNLSRSRLENVSSGAEAIKQRASSVLDDTLSSVLNSLELVRNEATSKNKEKVATKASNLIKGLTDVKEKLLSDIVENVDQTANTVISTKTPKTVFKTVSTQIANKIASSKSTEANKEPLNELKSKLSRVENPIDKVLKSFSALDKELIQKVKDFEKLDAAIRNTTNNFNNNFNNSNTTNNTTNNRNQGNAISAMIDVGQQLLRFGEILRDLTTGLWREVRQGLVEGSTPEGLNTARAFSGAGQVVKNAQVAAGEISGGVAGLILGGPAGAAIGSAIGETLGTLIPNPVSMFSEGLSLLAEISKNTSDQVRVFSGDLIVSKLNAQIRLLEHNIQRADTMGELLAQIENAQTDVNMELAKVSDMIIQAFGPKLTDLLLLIADILKIVQFVKMTPDEIVRALMGLFAPLGLGLPFVYTQMKRLFTEALIEAEKQAKEDEKTVQNFAREMSAFFDPNTTNRPIR